MSEPEGLDTGQALPTHDVNAKGEGRLNQEGRSSLQHQHEASSPSISDDADASYFSEDQDDVILDSIKTPAGTQIRRSGHSSEKSREGSLGNVTSLDTVKDANRSGSSLNKPSHPGLSTVTSREGYQGAKSKGDDDDDNNRSGSPSAKPSGPNRESDDQANLPSISGGPRDRGNFTSPSALTPPRFSH